MHTKNAISTTSRIPIDFTHLHASAYAEFLIEFHFVLLLS